MENHFPGSEIGQRAILMNNTFGCCILKFERFNALPLLESWRGAGASTRRGGGGGKEGWIL